MHVAYPVVLAAMLFSVGVYGVLARRNAILVLMSVELMLNGANLNLVTFDIWRSGYAVRIARLRGYNFQYAPELVGYLLSVPPSERLRMQGIGCGRWQRFFTVSGMVGLVTAVLAGAAAGLLAAVVSDHVLVAALVAGVSVAVAVFAALIAFQVSTWRRAAAL